MVFAMAFAPGWTLVEHGPSGTVSVHTATSPKAFLACPLEIATTSDLVAHGGVDSNARLTDAQHRATKCDTEVVDNVVLDSHDLLELHAPPHHEATQAKSSGAGAAAAPTEGRLPKPAHSRDSIGLGHTHQGATKAVDAHVDIVEARANVVVEVVTLHSASSHATIQILQRALPLEHWLDGFLVIAQGKAKHDEAPPGRTSHPTTE